MADSQSKNSNKSIVFRRNIDQYSLGEQGKDAEFLPCPEAKLKELTLSKCKQLFDEQVARTKHDYKFSTAKDPVFNSTRIWKVEDHCRKEHRCDCARTDRSLSMLEQNLKGQYRRAYLDYSRRGKEKCPWKVLSVVNFVALCMLNLGFL